MDQDKQQQVLALGRLGWTLTRIGRATGVHRVTAGEYLRAAGIPVRGRGRPGEGAAKPTISGEVSTDSASKPAIPPPGVSTDSMPSRAPTASACEPYRELIGDAVHATTPHMASGAGMAVEDGLVLAEELARHDDLGEALAAFTARRFERARMVVENSVRIGEIEMAGGNQMDANAMLGDTMHKLQQPY